MIAIGEATLWEAPRVKVRLPSGVLRTMRKASLKSKLVKEATAIVVEEGWLWSLPSSGPTGNYTHFPATLPLGCFGASHKMKDHLIFSLKNHAGGEGLHLLTSVLWSGVHDLRGSATPLQRGKRGAGAANTALPTAGPHLCLFCLVDTSCWSLVSKLGSSLFIRKQNPSIPPFFPPPLYSEPMLLSTKV